MGNVLRGPPTQVPMGVEDTFHSLMPAAFVFQDLPSKC